MSDIESVRESAAAGKLLVITGAGTSMGLASKSTPAVSWKALIQSALSFCSLKGLIDPVQLARYEAILISTDIDEMIGVATFATKKLGGPKGILFADWLNSVFSMQRCSNGAMKNAVIALSKSNVPIATLNYDVLLEKASRLSTISMDEPRKVMGWARREAAGILHLHGVWDKPHSVVFASEDYVTAVKDEFRQNLQRGLTSYKHVLFIGCGTTFEDPNLAGLITWMRSVVGTGALKHHALVLNSEVAERHKDKLWHGFVDPIGYGNDHLDLPQFIIDSIALPSKSQVSLSRRKKQFDTVVIDNYRSHLLKDCGKMTIEGVRADDDTANQKFDLEKLFVPLEVSAIPPEYVASDPRREEKLKRWAKLNPHPLTFGAALSKSIRIALLALPGGGKTLLLKRLAVAYADRQRRIATNDELPDFDLLPVLIRCREWRNYINLPIQSLIERIPEITGNRNLDGFYAALEPRLKSGRVLLLVDGLDEIHSDGDRSTFVENLEQFLNDYPKVRLVVTSREAGFALVAPSLMRFCARWRIAPLTSDAITLLCDHWHELMSSNTADAGAESREVVSTILANSALNRLAENPLLLTMLLVVKHGNGRLPPDRVSLYARAVEVLLDTWNIRGHAALGIKEAVPQLAYIAFRLMQQGKQTATEKELLSLIEECRVEVPLIRFYAKDTPSEFLKRVELRSSLLLEAGRTIEHGRAVPFYQFRHLTFQEYLAAVAVVEGHYDGYTQGEEITVPFSDQVSADEWKEVVPMAAVLAKKQANPLIMKLIALGEIEEADLRTNFADEKYDWSSSQRMPPPISRLTQCLVEEAEFSQDALDGALRLVATFAHGCMPSENWGALRRGPFGDALFDVAWSLYDSQSLPRQAWLRNTVSLLAGHARTAADWSSTSSFKEIELGLSAEDENRNGRAAASICGIMWLYKTSVATKIGEFVHLLARHLASPNIATKEVVQWAVAMLISRDNVVQDNGSPIEHRYLDDLVDDWVVSSQADHESIASFALIACLSFARNSWKPVLKPKTKAWVLQLLREQNNKRPHSPFEAAVLLMYHSGNPVDKSALILFSKRFRTGNAQDVIIEALANDVGVSVDEIRKVRPPRLSRQFVALD